MTASAGAIAAPPVAVAAVEEAIRSLAKAFRATQLYLPNNPTRAAAIDAARAAFARVWSHTDPLVVRIRESELVWNERKVFDDSERGAEGLPWLLYRDGLRELEFRGGFEQSSLEPLLALLQRVRTMAPDEDDLVTLLWVANLDDFAYRHVEHGVSSASRLTADHADGEESNAPPAAAAETEPVGDAPPEGVIRLEDFDSTLYFLDAGEIAYLQDELQREYADDPRFKVASIIGDIVAMRVDDADRAEALTALRDMLVSFLASNDLALAASVLREVSDVRLRIADDDTASPSLRAELDALAARLSEPAVLEQLLRSLEDGGSTASIRPETIEALFLELRPEALHPLVTWLGAAPASPTRAMVERASVRLAASHTAALASCLESPVPAAVRGALRVTAQVATPVAVPPLSRLLGVDDAALRAEAVATLREIGTPGALQAIERAIDDVERDVRVAALRGVAAHRYLPALGRVRGRLRRRELRSADLGEKMAVFEAFGALTDESGIAELDAILNARGLLGPKEPSEMRACAARALGLVGSAAAIDSLQRAADAKDGVVRSAVTRALRGGVP